MFPKSLNEANFLWNASQVVLFLKNVFSPCDVFLTKNQKIFKIGKITKYEEEYFEKSSHLLRRHLHQNWKAQNIPVVAGRPVKLLMEAFFIEFSR